MARNAHHQSRDTTTLFHFRVMSCQMLFHTNSKKLIPIFRHFISLVIPFNRIRFQNVLSHLF